MGKRTLWCIVKFHELCVGDCECSCHEPPTKLSGGF